MLDRRAERGNFTGMLRLTKGTGNTDVRQAAFGETHGRASILPPRKISLPGSIKVEWRPDKSESARAMSIDLELDGGSLHDCPVSVT